MHRRTCVLPRVFSRVPRPLKEPRKTNLQGLKILFQVDVQGLKDTIPYAFSRAWLPLRAMRGNELQGTGGALGTSGRVDVQGHGVPWEPSRAEPSRAEPSQAKPSRAEPSRAKPSRTEPNRTELSRTKPNRAEPSRTESNQTRPNRAELADTAIERVALRQTSSIRGGVREGDRFPPVDQLDGAIRATVGAASGVAEVRWIATHQALPLPLSDISLAEQEVPRESDPMHWKFIFAAVGLTIGTAHLKAASADIDHVDTHLSGHLKTLERSRQLGSLRDSGLIASVGTVIDGATTKQKQQ